MSRIEWPAIVERAREIVESYDTSVTLRQLFYRLVSEQLIPNSQTAYKRLSELTAVARRNGDFPELTDRGRQIHQYQHFDDVTDALSSILAWYRLDRTAGQDVSLYLGVEKSGIVNQLQAWFGNLGIPILALSGYTSQSYISDVVRHVESQRKPDRLIAEMTEDEIYGRAPWWRPAVLLYAGDFDPSGEDIDRDFVARTGCWDKVIRVALTAGQVARYQLPPNPGKATDSRAAGFIARHGELVQVELDALPPETLRALYQEAIAGYWDVSAYEAVLARENDDVSRLRAVARDA